MLDIKLGMVIPQSSSLNDITIHKVGNRIVNPKIIDAESDPTIKTQNESE